MKRALLSAVLLLSAAGLVFLQTSPPAPKVATLMPSGALLYLEAPDFGRLLRDWDASRVKAKARRQHQVRSIRLQQIRRTDIGVETRGDQCHNIHEGIGRLASILGEVLDLFHG